MWFRRKPKQDLPGCLAIFLLFVMASVGFLILLIMGIWEAVFS